MKYSIMYGVPRQYAKCEVLYYDERRKNILELTKILKTEATMLNAIIFTMEYCENDPNEYIPVLKALEQRLNIIAMEYIPAIQKTNTLADEYKEV